MRADDPWLRFSSGPSYLMFLSMEIRFLLLGPHVSHVVLVVFEAHLRDHSVASFPSDHESTVIRCGFLSPLLTLYSPIQSQELRAKLAAVLNLVVASATLFHSSSTKSVTSGTSTLYGNYRKRSFKRVR